MTRTRATKPEEQTPDPTPEADDLPAVTGSENPEAPRLQVVGEDGEVLATRDEVEAYLATTPRDGLDATAETMDLMVPDDTSDDDLRALILANLVFDGDVAASPDGEGVAGDTDDGDSRFFLVKATSDEGRVVLFERDSVHPEGEVFIVSDGREVLVGESWGVQQAIRAGTIERV